MSYKVRLYLSHGKEMSFTVDDKETKEQVVDELFKVLSEKKFFSVCNTIVNTAHVILAEVNQVD